MIRGPDKCDCFSQFSPGSFCIKSQCPFRKKRQEERGPRMSPDAEPPKTTKPNE